MDQSIQTIRRAVVRGIDLAAQTLADSMRKADAGELPLEAYTAQMKKAEDLLIQAARLDAIVSQINKPEDANAVSQPA